MLCSALKDGFNILFLVFEKCSFDESDLNKLLDVIINRSSVHRLLFITTEIRKFLRISKYVCGCMSVQVNNQSLKIQFFERFQDGDMKLLIRIWEQNKVCRVFNLFGGDFFGCGTDLLNYFETSKESTVY